MADWRSPVVSNSPWTQSPQYQNMDAAGSDEEKDAGTTPRGQVYNPFLLHPQPQAQPQSHPRPERLHIDDLRESPMRSDLISLESNPRAPIVHEPPSQTEGRPHPQQSVSSTEATSGSFLNQLVTGLWQPRRQAVPTAADRQDQELPTHYVQQQTPHAQQQQYPQQQQQLSGTRTFEDMLPRRSLLVSPPTEFDIGRRTLDPEEHLVHQPQRTTSPSMRNLQQFRPVAAPPAAVMAPSSGSGGSTAAPPRSTAVEAGRSLRPTPPQTEDERSRGVSTATSSSRQQREHNDNSASRATSVDRARQRFASKQVRLENSWYNDMWSYMKNAHPFIGIFGAHRWHPYKRRDRVVVLLVALLVTLLCCGVFATQKCCDVVLESPIAVVGRRLSSTSSLSSSSLSSTSGQHCTPFYGNCDAGGDSVALCTQGSSCVSVPGRSDKQCVPVATAAAASLSCGGADRLSCPTGWTCNETSHKCAPSSSLVCYLPRTSSSPPVSVSFAADSGTSGEDGGMTAIEAIFSILIIANGNSTSSSSSTNSSSDSGSGGSRPTDSSTDGGAIGSSPSASASTPVDARNDQVAQSISVALTKPSDGGVYSVASSIPIEWEVSSLSGSSGDQPLKSFSVEFSADGKTFATIATDVTSSSTVSSEKSTDKTSAVFHFDWQLNNNASLLCTNCVLRVCAAVGGDASAKNTVCIRSDGGGGAATDTSNSLVVTRSASAAARKGITFRIVREILQCSCGLAHSSFVQFSYLIALVLPLTVLLLQQLVTFYEDSKVWGLFARRGGPEIPLLCYYGRGTTRIGRVLVVLVLAAACLGSGFQVAQVNETNFYNQTGEIVLLWLGMYALCALIGFIYCSAACLASFSLRWRLELTHKSRVGNPPDDFDAVSVHVPSLEEEGHAGNRTPVLQA